VGEKVKRGEGVKGGREGGGGYKEGLGDDDEGSKGSNLSIIFIDI